MSSNYRTQKLLSIVLQGRNDSYMGNFLWRLATCINKHARNVFELGVEDDVEIVLADWGSESPLVDALDLEGASKRLLRVVHVPPVLAAHYNRDSPYSWVHALNCGVRRSVGEFVLISDSDGYLPVESTRKILAGIRAGRLGECPLDNSFFVGSRFHIPASFHRAGPSISEIDTFIEERASDLSHEKVDLLLYAGNAASYLWERRIWDESCGFDERFIYWGWYDTDMFLRLSARYRAGDLEDVGIPTYHLEHYSNSESRKIRAGLSRRINRGVSPTKFAPNGPLWGLGGETLRITSWMGPSDKVRNSDLPLTESADKVYFRLVQAARLLNVIRLLISRYGEERPQLKTSMRLVATSREAVLKLTREWFNYRTDLSSGLLENLAQGVLSEADQLILDLSRLDWFKELWEKQDERDQPYW